MLAAKEILQDPGILSNFFSTHSMWPAFAI